MSKKHDYDAAWKTILEAFEVEVVEVLFPEIFLISNVPTMSEKFNVESSESELLPQDAKKRLTIISSVDNLIFFNHFILHYCFANCFPEASG